MDLSKRYEFTGRQRTQAKANRYVKSLLEYLFASTNYRRMDDIDEAEFSFSEAEKPEESSKGADLASDIRALRPVGSTSTDGSATPN